jgi:hypothetical protein
VAIGRFLYFPDAFLHRTGMTIVPSTFGTSWLLPLRYVFASLLRKDRYGVGNFSD